MRSDEAEKQSTETQRGFSVFFFFFITTSVFFKTSDQKKLLQKTKERHVALGGRER